LKAKASTKPLTQQDFEFFKGLLIQQLDDLLNQAKKTVGTLMQDGALSPDPLDRASEAMGRDFILRIRDREYRLIQKIKTTLEKIQDGTFGICENCGEDISFARLKARPVTSYCIHCKSKMEAMEKRMAG
jgi:DnaK suppressor protein